MTFFLVITGAFAAIIIAILVERKFIKRDMEKNPDYLADKDLRENMYKLIAAIAIYIGLIAVGFGFMAILQA